MKKTAFYVVKEIHGKGIPHLFIVISDPDSNDEVLVVNISKLKSGRDDRSCLLKKGEHSSIKVDSYIPYHFAECMKMQTIKDKCRDHIYTVAEDISDSLLKKIQEGAKKSLFLQKGLKRFFDKF